jgi:hypothetical protein
MLTASIIKALEMKTVSTSETWANFCEFVQCNIPEESNLHIGRRESLKSPLEVALFRITACGTNMIRVIHRLCTSLLQCEENTYTLSIYLFIYFTMFQ